MRLGRHTPGSSDIVWLLAARGVETKLRILEKAFQTSTTLSHCKYCFPQLLYVIPYPADMSPAKAAKHHDRVLCHSGFFVAQFSFYVYKVYKFSWVSHPLHLQSTESTTPTLQLLWFRSQEIDSSTGLPSEAAKYDADPTDQATSSDVKRRNRTDPTDPTPLRRSFCGSPLDSSPATMCWSAGCSAGAMAAKSLLCCSLSLRFFHFLHQSKENNYYCTLRIALYHQ